MRSSMTRRPLAEPWGRYQPSDDAPWNLDRVAHLHRRSGFAPPWRVLQRDLKDGPDAAIDRILAGEPRSLDDQEAATFEAGQDEMDRFAASTGTLASIQSAWLYRLVFTPWPLRERMTLFWHNHFATSFAKVNSASLMVAQIELLRANALGSFSTLLKAIARDPAMLLWLDSATNRKAHPNENYAREVMELFALGRGNYTEKDIQEAARAFTGSFIQGDRFKQVEAQHDDGPKTILGQTGVYSGDDVANILLDQEVCARFVCGKLIKAFVNEVVEPDDALIAPLAARFRESKYEIQTPVEMILRSRLFFDKSSIRSRVKSPVEFAIGLVRSLEILRPTVGLDVLAERCGEMGQSLYAPPSVAGWDGGAAWINTSSALVRTNLVLSLLSQSDEKLGGRFDPGRLYVKHAQLNAGRFYMDLLLQDALDEGVRAGLTSAFDAAGQTDVKLRDAVALALATPEYQLA